MPVNNLLHLLLPANHETKIIKRTHVCTGFIIQKNSTCRSLTHSERSNSILLVPVDDDW